MAVAGAAHQTISAIFCNAKRVLIKVSLQNNKTSFRLVVVCVIETKTSRELNSVLVLKYYTKMLFVFVRPNP